MDPDTEPLDAFSIEDRFFLEIALKNGLITPEAAELAGRMVHVERVPFAEAVRRLRLLEEEQIHRVREAITVSQVVRLDALYGDIATKLGVVPHDRLREAYLEQRAKHYQLRLADILMERGYLSLAAHRQVILELIRQLKCDTEMSTGREQRPRTMVVDLPSPADRPRTLIVEPPRPTPKRPRTVIVDALSPTEPELSPLSAPVSSPSHPTIGLEKTNDSDGSGRFNSFLSVTLAHLDSETHGPEARTQSLPGLASSSDDAFLASALRFGLHSQADLRDPDERLLQADLRRAASVEQSFVLDRLALSATDNEGKFSPERYVEQRQRRARLLRIGGGALVLGALLLGIVLVTTFSSNQSALEEGRQLIAQAESRGDPEEKQRLFLEATQRLANVGSLGVSLEKLEEQRGRARWGGLRAEVLIELSARRPQQALQLIERRQADVPADEEEEYGSLRRRALRELRLMEAAGSHAEGDYPQAVLAYREALQLGDPGGLAREQLDSIRTEVWSRMERAFQKALRSLTLIDEQRFDTAARVVQDLFPQVSGISERRQELEFRRAMTAGESAYQAEAFAAAVEEFTKAESLRPGDEEARSGRLRALRAQECRELQARGKESERQGRMEDAAQHYRQALELAQRRDQATLRAAIARCVDRAGAQDHAGKWRQLLVQAVDAFKDSRIDEAEELLQQLVQAEDTEGQATKLLELARQVRGMRYIPAGEFLMGSLEGSPPLEQPQRRVVLPAYFIDTTEVTNEAYASFVAGTGTPLPRHWDHKIVESDGTIHTTYPSRLRNHPVVQITWEEARTYAIWRGGKLPTEAQWEKAARGTDGRTYPWGEKATGVKVHVGIPPDPRREFPTAVVGSHPDDASPYGVLDMAGNVNEWTDNLLALYPGGPSGAELPREPRRVLRGGAHRYSFREARCAARDAARERDYRSTEVGFRVVVEIPVTLAEILE